MNWLGGKIISFALFLL